MLGAQMLRSGCGHQLCSFGFNILGEKVRAPFSESGCSAGCSGSRADETPVFLRAGSVSKPLTAGVNPQIGGLDVSSDSSFACVCPTDGR